MAIQKRITFGLEDVAAIRMTCRGCGAEYSLRGPAYPRDMPSGCLSCNKIWRDENSLRWVREFLKLTEIEVEKLKKASEEGSEEGASTRGWSIRLEIEASD